MNQFLQIIKLIFVLLPLVIDAIKAVEAAVPAGGQGAAKLDAIRGMLQSAYTVADSTMPTFEKLWPALSGTVGAIVGLFNKTSSWTAGTGSGAAIQVTSGQTNT